MARLGYAVHAYVRTYGKYPPWRREPREVSRPKSTLSDVLMLAHSGMLHIRGKASYYVNMLLSEPVAQ